MKLCFYHKEKERGDLYRSNSGIENLWNAAVTQIDVMIETFDQGEEFYELFPGNFASER
jgi:hypothetical protein